MSAHADLIPRIKRLLVDCLDLDARPDELPDDLSLNDRKTGGIDSIEAVALVLGLEQEFGIRFEDGEIDLEVLSSVPGLETLVRGKLGRVDG